MHFSFFFIFIEILDASDGSKIQNMLQSLCVIKIVLEFVCVFLNLNLILAHLQPNETVYERWVIDWTMNKWSMMSRSERLKKQAYNTKDKTKTVFVVSVLMLMKDARVLYFRSSHFFFVYFFESVTKPNRCVISSLLQLTHHNLFTLYFRNCDFGGLTIVWTSEWGRGITFAGRNCYGCDALM